jgi:hypothetical protein
MYFLPAYKTDLAKDGLLQRRVFMLVEANLGFDPGKCSKTNSQFLTAESAEFAFYFFQ